jgi:DNA-binding SARP family transcriptional activator
MSAGIGLLVLLGGVPLALLEFAGAPSLRGLPDLEGIRRAIELKWVPVDWAIQVLALLAWALWTYLFLAVILRIAGRLELRLSSAGRLWAASEAVSWSPVKLAVDLVMGAALMSSAMAEGSIQAEALKQQPGWSSTIAPHVATMRAVEERPHEAGTTRTERPPTDTSELQSSSLKGGNGTYIVRPGDSLWSIAESNLDDPYRWTTIWQLNQGREMPDGERLLRPGYIRPGWRLRLPTVERQGGSPPHAEDDRRREHERKSDGDPQSPSSSRGEGSRGREAFRTKSPGDEAHHGERLNRVELPSGTVVSVGFIAGFLTAVGLQELRRRRQRKPHPLAHGWPNAGPTSDLKARFLRALAALEGDREEIDSEVVEEVVRQSDNRSSEIVLGYRSGSPVVAKQRGTVYAFVGDPEEVISYLRDLSLHSLISHRSEAEVWTMDDLELGSLRGVRAFAEPRALVSELEVEILKRHRLFDEESVKDWNSHQEAWPDDSLHLVIGMAVAGFDPLRNRLEAIATQGQDLGLVIFGQGSASNAIRIEGKSLCPLGELRDLLGEPFDAIVFDEKDRTQLLKELGTSPGAEERDEPMQISQTTPAQAVDTESRIRVGLFGPPTIRLGDEEISGNLRRKSRELLIFFLLHPQGVGRDQALEALWPEQDPDKAAEKFSAQLGDIRRSLRHPSNPTAKFIDKSGDIYRVGPADFDVDVWRFDRFLAQASKGDRVREALKGAAHLYRGELLEGIYYEWASELRDHFRGRLIDVLGKLAEVCERDGDIEEATQVLARAIILEPYAEHMYRQLMSAYGKLGRATDIVRVYRELEAALSEALDAEPTGETVALRDELIGDLRQGAQG